VSGRVLTDMINAAGWRVDYATVRTRFAGEALVNIVAGVEAEIGAPVPDGWLDTFRARRDDAFRAGIEAIDGAAEAVRGVQALGCETCVASQAALAKTRLTLGLTGLADLFGPDRLFSGMLVDRPKPAPDLFVHAAATCGYAPGECVVVEDGVLGVRGARAAGMPVLAYPADADAEALEDAGGELIASLRDVPGRVALLLPGA
jgi:beta-phosphoglucomutase-like phosphatase (HAD superfamily)